MPDVNVKIEIDMKAFLAAIQKAPGIIAQNLKGAAQEASEEILDTEGVRSYPSSTSANAPPYPYYKRNIGTQTSAYHNMLNSENYGKQWNVKTQPYGVTIGNRASYAPYVGGEKSPHHMRTKGWRRLLGVAKEKVQRGIIGAIYEKWIARALRQAGFK